MGNFIEILLYITGYTYDYKENINEPPLSIRSAPNNTFVPREVSATKRSKFTKFPGVCYNALIVIIMIWRVAYAIYMAIRDKSSLHFGRTLFQILFVVQYILGIIYFRKQHFYKNITTKSSMISKFKVLVPFTVVIALGLAITMTVLMCTDSNIHAYSELFQNATISKQTPLAILLFVDSFYSYLTFLINACVFAVNMLYQKQMVSNYADSLDDFIKSSEDTESKVSVVAKDYALTKDSWDETVEVLNFFFVFLNFGGFITVYFYIQAFTSGVISADEITNFVIFILIDLIYIISISNVNRDIGRISDSIGSTSMMVQYFTNEQDDSHSLNNLAGKLQRLGEPYDVEMGLRNTKQKVVITTRPSVSDGDDSDNSLGKQSGQYNFDALNQNLGVDNQDEVYMMDPNVNSSLRKILTTVTGIQNMANWMALQEISNGTWKTFRLFGVQLTDTTLLSRLFGLLVALGIGSELISSINWYG